MQPHARTLDDGIHPGCNFAKALGRQKTQRATREEESLR